MKKCTKCKENKQETEFHKDKSRGDGLNASCKACKLRECKNYNRENRAERNKRTREYYRKNRATANARNKAYVEKRPLTQTAANANLRAKRAGVKGKLSIVDVENIFALYPKCLSCGSREQTLDHIAPLSKGGPNTVENLQILCGGCNLRKRTKTIDYRYGPQLPREFDPV